MNNRHVLLTGVPVLASGTAFAEMTSTLTLATDNVSRGISDTNGDPAIQGSFDYDHPDGTYAGLWASNVKFRENADAPAADTVDEASIEIDYYFGYSDDLFEAMNMKIWYSK